MATKWVKQYASKRWHKLRNAGNIAICGKRTVATREADQPPGWHLACRGCLAIMNKPKEKTT